MLVQLCSNCDAAQVDSALAVVRGVLAGKSLGDALVATRQRSASEYQYQFVKARNDYLQQARPGVARAGFSLGVLREGKGARPLRFQCLRRGGLCGS